MRKVIVFIISLLAVQFISAQRATNIHSPEHLFFEGKSMYEDGNFAGCIDKIMQYKKQDVNLLFTEEADFLLVASDYNQGRKDATHDLKTFLETHPTTIHFDEITYMIGSLHFQKKEYAQAVFWFNQTDIDLISPKEQAHHSYRKAFSSMKTGNKKEAVRLFSLLREYSSVYHVAATYYLAYIYYDNEEYNEALNLFERLRNNETYREDALYYICQIDYVQGRYPQVIKEGNALLKEFPYNSKNAEINRILGGSYYYENDFDKAIRYLNSFIKSNKEVSSEDYYMLGVSYFKQNNFYEAINYLRLSNPGNNLQGQNTFMYIGQACLKTNDFQNAMRSYESASRINADAQAKEAATYNYAMLLHKNSVTGFGESVSVLENFLNTYPNSIYSDNVNDALVEVYMTTKDYDTALKSISKIKNPGNKILAAKQKIYYYLGTVAYANNSYTDAVKYFSQSIDGGNYAVKEKIQSYYWRGESHYRKEEYDKAIGDYNTFLQSDFDNVSLRNNANYNIAYSYFNKEDYTTASSHFRTFIAAEKQNSRLLSDAYSRLGDCSFFSRRFAEADKYYTQSVNLTPESSDYAIFQKGFVAGLQKDYNTKIIMMERLIAAYPNSPYVTDAYYEKGHASMMLDNNAAAIETFQSLQNKYPNSNSARKAALQTALLYYNDNQPAKAAEAYKNVIAKYPGSEEAKVAVQDLKMVYFDMNDISGYSNYVRSLGGTFNPSEADSLTFLSAERLFTNGNIAGAQTAFNNYLLSYPQGTFSANAHYYLANIYYKQQNYSDAKREYAQLLLAGNTQYTEEAVARTAELHYRAAEYSEALALYQRLQVIAATKVNREVGALGVIRSGAQLKRWADIIPAATALLNDNALSPEVAIEARYYRAKASLATGALTQGENDLETLAKDTRTAFGAEAKYLLAQHYFDTGHPAEAKIIVQDYIQSGSPHSYWLARSYILLSDVYASEKDYLQARQYLESLQSNYKNTSDDIQQLVKEHLEKLKK